MDKLYYTLVMIFLVSVYTAFAQDLPKTDLIPDDKTIILDQNGNEIENKELFELLSSGEWTVDPIFENGKITHMQVRQTSPDEEEFLTSMMKRSNDKSMIGTPAPNFEATDLSLNKINTEAFDGKIIVLNFWFADCPPCVREIPELNAVYKAFESNDQVEFIAITFDDSKKAKNIIKEYDLLYPVVADRRDICKQYSIFAYPTNIVINQKGEYYFFESGGREGIGDEIERAINMALKGMRSPQLNSEKLSFTIDLTKTFILTNGDTLTVDKAQELIKLGYHVAPQLDKNAEQYFILKKPGE